MEPTLKQASSLFGFLKALLRLRNKPVKTLAGYANTGGHWIHHLDETPITKSGVAFWGSLGLRALDALSGDITSAIQLGITTFKETKNSILRIPKVVLPDPPQPSEDLGPWIEGDFDDAWANISLRDFAEITINADDETVSIEELKSHPGIQRDFHDWKSRWDDWAEKAKKDFPLQRLYTSLFEVREQIKDQGQEWEFVLGLGRLRLGIGTDREIDRHIFTIPCVIDLDPTTGVLFVRIDEEHSYRIEDDWIQGFKKPEMEDLNQFLAILNQVEDLSDEIIKQELIKLAHKYRADIVTDIDPADFKKRDSLVIAPTLILRKRGKQDLIKLLEKLENAFQDSNQLPAPLISLLEPGHGEKTSSEDWSGDGAVVIQDSSAYLPLTLNTKQLKALESADTRNATIIQGPPGTGKTRTIAVMVSHFLAKGQRVLVAAQTPQALREVRSQLPDEIKDLAVASLSSTKNDNDDLQKSVNALVDRYENRFDLYDNFEKFEKDIVERIEKNHEERASSIRAIIDLRSAETETIKFDGVTSSKAELAWQHLSQRQEFSWLEEISDPKCKAPEYDSSHAGIIATALNSIWTSTPRVSLNYKLPANDSIWTEEFFSKGLRLKELSQKQVEPLSLASDFAVELVKLIEPAIECQVQLQKSRSKWIDKALNEALAGEDQASGVRISTALMNLKDLDACLDSLGQVNEIDAPLTSIDWLPILDSISERVAKKGNLKTSVTGEIKKSLISSSVIKNAEKILNQVKILGRAPSNTNDIEKVKALVKFDRMISAYIGDMVIETSEVPNSRFERIVWIKDQVRLLQISQTFAKSCSDIRLFLNRKLAKSAPWLARNLDLDSLFDSALSINAKSELKSFDRDLTLHLANMRSFESQDQAESIIEYCRCLSGNSIEAFVKARVNLLSLVENHDKSVELFDYVKALAKNDKTLHLTLENWIDELHDSDKQQEILTTVHKLVDAFRWKRLGDTLASNSDQNYESLFESVRRHDRQIEKLVRELAMRRSWKKALERIDAKTLSQMQRYALESRKLGAGTGITAARRIRDIRKLLNDCRSAIPAWIMSIDLVVQRFTPELEMFDVVIVDEASQARLDALFLLALSKRVVIVGDHKQVSPDRGMVVDAEVQQLVQRHLAGDQRQANWGNADLSLFDECKTAFSNMITLTEHRRCVPEIIGFSNQIAYIPENIRLVPVRQTGSESLKPIRTIFVENGYVRLTGNQPVNPPEADAIADEVAKIIKDPKYRNMTIGVVTLQGSKQQEIIREKLIRVIDPSEWESRQLKVGTPPDFQGSERDVILLSLVMAPNGRSTAQTTDRMVQRYNVAASRAKNQMILVHSLRSSDIRNPNDLRKQLIEYCLNVESEVGSQIEGAVGFVSETERVEPFDSLFEQRVHNQIVARGYKVIPQYEPQIEGYGYRIDLVVVGRSGKFAVECDGDRWHGEAEFEKDILRQENLERAGWQFFRIRESHFYADPNALENLWSLLQKFVKSTPELSNEFEKIPSEESSKIADSNLESINDSAITQEVYEDESEIEDIVAVKDKFSPESFSFTEAGSAAPREIYVDGMRIREFPKPISAEYSWMQAYQSWDPEESRRITKVDSQDNQILEELFEIVRIEGPILGSYLMRRHYKASGGSSLSSQKESLYLKRIKSVINRGEIIAEEQISGENLATASFRTHNQPPVITRVRGARDLYDMPPREVAMIIRGVMQTHRDLAKAHHRGLLFRQVLLLLDFTKLTRKAEEYLTRIFINYAEEVTK